MRSIVRRDTGETYQDFLTQLAQASGIGAVWCGLVKFVISDLLPELRGHLGIPDDHVVGYAMAFGYPAVQYARTVQRGPADVHWV